MLTKRNFIIILALVISNITFAKSDKFVEINIGKYCWIKSLNKVDFCYKQYFSVKQIEGIPYTNIKNKKQLNHKALATVSKSNKTKIEIFKTPVINHSKVAWGFGINKKGIFGGIIF